MKEAVVEKKSLTTEERNYLSVAYKNVVGARRSAYRVLSSVLERDRDDADKKKIVEDYRQTIKDELFKYCQDLLVRSTIDSLNTTNASRLIHVQCIHVHCMLLHNFL